MFKKNKKQTETIKEPKEKKVHTVKVGTCLLYTSFLKSQITYALRPKITYAGKAVKLHKQILNETITAVRSVNYVPDKIY